MYIQNGQLATHLSLGKSVEQWLGATTQGDYSVIRWIGIDKGEDGAYRVSYCEKFDDGSEDFLDVYEFEDVDPDLPNGREECFPTYDEALVFCRERYQCRDEKYVNRGMVQEEYRLYLLSSGGQKGR